jgi:hypothetical protein
MSTNITENGQSVDYFFCLPGKEFSGEFLIAWSNTLLSLVASGKTFMFNNLYSPIVQETRNMLLNTVGRFNSAFLSTELFDGMVSPKKVIFLDSDIVWSLQDMDKILNSDHDIVCGTYLTVNGDLACGFDSQRLPYSFLNETYHEVELAFTGMGFMAVKFDVLKKMKAPWFQVEYKETDGKIDMVGEDTYFCNKARELGYSIYLDPTIRLKHMKTVALQVPMV